jgi:hypothetical protein
MAVTETDAISIARNYIEQTVHIHGESLDEISLDDPIAHLSDPDRSNYYPNSRAIWLVRFFYLPSANDGEDANCGYPPPCVRICIDAETGEVWRYTNPQKPTNRQKRNARKERRAAKKNRNIES